MGRAYYSLSMLYIIDLYMLFKDKILNKLDDFNSI